MLLCLSNLQTTLALFEKEIKMRLAMAFSAVSVLFLASCSQVKLSSPKQRDLSAFREWTPAVSRLTIHPGHVKAIMVELPELEASFPKLYCNQQQITPLSSSERFFKALISETYFSTMKPYKCLLKLGGFAKEIAIVEVDEFSFPEEKLNVDKKRVFLAPEDQKRVVKEQAMLNEIYANSQERPYYSQSFQAPLNSLITSQYGSRRLFNQNKRTQHLGTDYRAAVGRPVPAVNVGRVVFTGELFYTGNTVIIDHGGSLFSVYGHLSEIDVANGQIVAQGEFVAKAGNTGRTTGPHLHWGVKHQGNWVSGNSLIKESKRLF